MTTYKAQAVVEVTLDAEDEYEAAHRVSKTLAALEDVTGGRVRTFDYSGAAVRRDDRKLRHDYRRVGEPDPALDTADLGGAFDYLFTVIEEVDHNAHARRELVKIRKALLS